MNQLVFTAEMFSCGSIVSGMDNNGNTYHLYKTSAESHVLHFLKADSMNEVSHTPYSSIPTVELKKIMGNISYFKQTSNPQAIAILNNFANLQLRPSLISIQGSDLIRKHTDYPITKLTIDEINSYVGCYLAEAFMCLVMLIDNNEQRNAIGEAIKTSAERMDAFDNVSNFISMHAAKEISESHTIKEHAVIKAVMDALIIICERLTTEFAIDAKEGNEAVFDLCLNEVVETLASAKVEINATRTKECTSLTSGRLKNPLLKNTIVCAVFKDIEALAIQMLNRRIIELDKLIAA